VNTALELSPPVSRKKSKHKCASCRSPNVKATAVGERIIRGLRTGTKQTLFQVKMHRLRCYDCKAYRKEKIDFISGSHKTVSRSLERTVIELRRHMTISAAADYFGLHWSTVKNIEKSKLEKKYKSIPLKHVKSIGIDEVYLGKKRGEKGYITVVRDLQSGAVLHVGKGKKGECLDAFAERMKRSKSTIEYVAVDLSPTFTAWIQNNFPEATIVYDHFHVIKLMNDKLNAIRRRIMRELDDEDKTQLKGKRWHFLMNEQNLKIDARDQLKNCCELYKELGIAHALKEGLRRIYRIRDLDLAQNSLVYWCELAENSQIKELVTMANTIRRHGEGIFAFWKTGITSASMEGFNNKIGWLTRQAYGYRDEEYLILKIYDLPNQKMIKVL